VFVPPSQPEARTDLAPAKPASEQPLVAAAPPPQASPQMPKDEPASTADRDVKTEKERAADKLDDATISADTAKRKAAEDQRELQSAAKNAPSKIAGPRQQQANAQNSVVTQGRTVDGLATGFYLGSRGSGDHVIEPTGPMMGPHAVADAMPPGGRQTLR